MKFLAESLTMTFTLLLFFHCLHDLFFIFVRRFCKFSFISRYKYFFFAVPYDRACLTCITLKDVFTFPESSIFFMLILNCSRKWQTSRLLWNIILTWSLIFFDITAITFSKKSEGSLSHSFYELLSFWYQLWYFLCCFLKK